MNYTLKKEFGTTFNIKEDNNKCGGGSPIFRKVYITRKSYGILGIKCKVIIYHEMSHKKNLFYKFILSFLTILLGFLLMLFIFKLSFITVLVAVIWVLLAIIFAQRIDEAIADRYAYQNDNSLEDFKFVLGKFKEINKPSKIKELFSNLTHGSDELRIMRLTKYENKKNKSKKDKKR